MGDKQPPIPHATTSRACAEQYATDRKRKADAIIARVRKDGTLEVLGYREMRDDLSAERKRSAP